MKQRKILTPEEARQYFFERGINVSAWARRHGLPEKTVYEVLAGRKKGRRGKCHKAAVLLGIKKGVLEEVDQ